MACGKANPCCNKCFYEWRSAEEPKAKEPPVLSGVAVPEPVQKGCGVAFELDLKGHYEGDSFVVASFKKVPPRKAADTASQGVKPDQPLRSIASSVANVHAIAAPPACTEKKCPESNPCCNRCRYSSWEAKDAPTRFPLKLCGIAVPPPEQDGCGAAFDLELIGRSTERCFSVQSFKKLPPTKR